MLWNDISHEWKVAQRSLKKLLADFDRKANRLVHDHLFMDGGCTDKAPGVRTRLKALLEGFITEVELADDELMRLSGGVPADMRRTVKDHRRGFAWCVSDGFDALLDPHFRADKAKHAQWRVSFTDGVRCVNVHSFDSRPADAHGRYNANGGVTYWGGIIAATRKWLGPEWHTPTSSSDYEALAWARAMSEVVELWV